MHTFIMILLCILIGVIAIALIAILITLIERISAWLILRSIKKINKK